METTAEEPTGIANLDPRYHISPLEKLFPEWSKGDYVDNVEETAAEPAEITETPKDSPKEGASLFEMLNSLRSKIKNRGQKPPVEPDRSTEAPYKVPNRLNPE